MKLAELRIRASERIAEIGITHLKAPDYDLTLNEATGVVAVRRTDPRHADESPWLLSSTAWHYARPVAEAKAKRAA